MCGIAGVLNLTGSRDQLERNAMAMADSLAHRGPDDPGIWSDTEAGIALVHRQPLTGRPETLLRDAVSRRMVTDVPFGAFLSSE